MIFWVMEHSQLTGSNARTKKGLKLGIFREVIERFFPCNLQKSAVKLALIITESTKNNHNVDCISSTAFDHPMISQPGFGGLLMDWCRDS
ncbi:hypothetical protein M8C21_011802 [Ambrosia artemisiifolia]|uniref:Uncharacterized protein n=1 Tax=Ambrosia artemisiifolia TaxID=4212 RepID=A0AAD5GJ14_AMBAR|nr:hypothetical protein M8C21_011802 [Ambrosia artemisiifolia]